MLLMLLANPMGEADDKSCVSVNKKFHLWAIFFFTFRFAQVLITFKWKKKIHANTRLIRFALTQRWIWDFFLFTFRFPSVHCCLSFARKDFFIDEYKYTFLPRDGFVFTFRLPSVRLYISLKKENGYIRSHIHILN